MKTGTTFDLYCISYIFVLNFYFSWELGSVLLSHNWEEGGGIRGFPRRGFLSGLAPNFRFSTSSTKGTRGSLQFTGRTGLILAALRASFWTLPNLIFSSHVAFTFGSKKSLSHHRYLWDRFRARLEGGHPFRQLVIPWVPSRKFT